MEEAKESKESVEERRRRGRRLFAQAIDLAIEMEIAELEKIAEIMDTTPVPEVNPDDMSDD